jgi:hypothetical protein
MNERKKFTHFLRGFSLEMGTSHTYAEIKSDRMFSTDTAMKRNREVS